MSALHRVLFGFVLLLAAACAGSSAPRSADAPSRSNVITAAELERFSAQPVRQAIERLRPQYLRTRGRGSINMSPNDVIVVYLGNTRMGSVEALDQIRASDVREVRYLTPTEASQRFGVDHTSGAIILVPR